MRRRVRRVDWGSEAADWLAKWIHRHVREPRYKNRIDYKACLIEIQCTPNVCDLFDASHLTHTCLYEKAKRMARARGVYVNEL
jgi:hypothetical protein